MIERTLYKFYGVRVADHANWEALDEDPGICLNNGEVGYFHAGAHDKHRTYLINSVAKVDVGEEIFHSGVHAVAPKFERDRWNDDLLMVADRLGLDVTEGPGWFAVESED